MALRATFVVAALALTSTLSWAEDLLPGTYYRLTQPDGAQTSTVRQSPTPTSRYDVLSSSGQRKATARVSLLIPNQLDVRAANGSRVARLRSNPVNKGRLDVLDNRGHRTGYWEQSTLTGRWHRYGTDGRRLETAERVK